MTASAVTDRSKSIRRIVKPPANERLWVGAFGVVARKGAASTRNLLGLRIRGGRPAVRASCYALLVPQPVDAETVEMSLRANFPLLCTKRQPGLLR